jgi:hypothetical protein
MFLFVVRECLNDVLIKKVMRVTEIVVTNKLLNLIQQLLAIGAAPYLVTLSDRNLFAREAELLQDTIRAEEDELFQAAEVDAEIGVGLPRQGDDDGDEDERGVDHGEYGDRAALPDGRDHPETGFSNAAGSATSI